MTRVILAYLKGDNIIFDRRIKTQNGWVSGVEAIDVVDDVVNLAKDESPKHTDETTTTKKAIPINEYHNNWLTRIWLS